MGHLSANPAGPNPSGEARLGREPGSKGHRWLWIVGLAVLGTSAGRTRVRRHKDQVPPVGEAKVKAAKEGAQPGS
jgi:hypothetical protein